jgi:hypothetical protein
MNKDGPNGSPYETLATHDQSETKRDTKAGMIFSRNCLIPDSRSAHECFLEKQTHLLHEQFPSPVPIIVFAIFQTLARILQPPNSRTNHVTLVNSLACSLLPECVMFPPHVTSTSAIEKGKWLEWRDTPERTDSSGSNRPVEPDLDLDEEESFIVGRLVSADVIEHETDHAPDYGNYGVISSRLALS